MGIFREKMIKHMIIKGLAENTQRGYLADMENFIRHFNKSPEKITLEEIFDYQYYLKTKTQYDWSTFNRKVCAIRYFYIYILKKKWDINHIPYTKKQNDLPIVLSKNEIVQLFYSTENIKHRTILLTLYSAGLRVSDLVNLTTNDIDSERMMIRIRLGKGNKDRYTILSKKLLNHLRYYWKSMQIKPIKWLFSGYKPNKQICRKSVYSIIKTLQKKSGIKKNISPHTLRHCFSTHLLEAGVDIRRIQILLGHTSLSTTSKYLHIAKDYLSKVESPIDTIDSIKI